MATSYPTTSLQPGSQGAAVKQLQDYLVSQGLMTQAQVNTGYGIYGPQTTAAVKVLQQRLGVDNSSGPGYWGPKTLAAVQGGGQSGKTDPNQPYSDSEYENRLNQHPKVVESVNAGNTIAQIEAAAISGDFSGLKNQYGQPFSVEEQTKALAQGMEDNRLYYETQQAKEKADAESALAQRQANYQDSLIKSGEDFQADRAELNQRAVNQGVLFSGSNAQKQAKLKTAYERDQASKLAAYGRDVGNVARDYQYNYGNNAAGGLSQFYNAGGNTFGLESAKGTVGSSGLSSVYNPNQYDFGAGTVMGQRSSLAKQFAARKLGNQGNKLLATSYNNQF
jgi:hypothetical protein